MLSSILLSIVTLIPVAPKEVQRGESFTYHLEISKGNVKNVARYKAFFPKDLKVEAVSTQGAQFTYENGEVKLIWVFIPPEDDIVISFIVRVPDNFNQDINITGSFDYVLGQNKMHQDQDPVHIKLVENSKAVQKNNVYYKVQVLASNKPLAEPINYFDVNYGIVVRDLQETSHEGMIKYVTGSFQDISSAMYYRDKLENSGCPAPFVVAYNRGVRIPVSEALTLTKFSK